jgi:hypothetical protein
MACDSLTKEEKRLLKRYLKFMRGFEESSLYEDYQEVEGMGDDEYAEAVDLIWKLSQGKVCD